MVVVHVGPPTGRLGGPAGYLHQLQCAAAAAPQPRHDVRFPESSSTTPRRPPPGAGLTISPFTRLRRKLFGPKFYRPPAADLARRGGVVEKLLGDVSAVLRADTEPSLERAIAEADVIFTHEPFAADDALARRRPGQQVWMMCHNVMPIGVYVAWSWAVPEAEWTSLLDYPDVRASMDWERDVWMRVDRFIIPCAEAADSFRMIDARLARVLGRADYVLSGAAAPSTGGATPSVLGPRRPGERIGLYLGNTEPYRGFDALVAGAALLGSDANVSIAVAGPPPSKVPAHPALRALGRVEDVAALLASVDFLINVNRFSLFDLSTIEAVEAGKPLLLHAVGGNRAFERMGAGCVMLGDLEPSTIADGLNRIASLSASSLSALGSQSRACWENSLTPQHMWERHLALYDQAAGVA